MKILYFVLGLLIFVSLPITLPLGMLFILGWAIYNLGHILAYIIGLTKEEPPKGMMGKY